MLRLRELSGAKAGIFDFARSSRRQFRSPRLLILAGALWVVAPMFTFVFSSSARAQEQAADRRPANNEFAIWFGGQFGDAHAFSETTNARLYQLESRYGRLVFARRTIAVRYVAEVVPWTTLGDPHTRNGSRAYAKAFGGSPIGAQVNFLHHRRVQPFVTSGGGFLYFDRRMFGTTQQFNFTAQFGGGLQLFSSSRRTALDLGYKYHHISNANMDRTNPGLDSHMLFVGVSFLR